MQYICVVDWRRHSLEKIRVITAYDLDAGQKRDYLERRIRGE